MWKLIVAILCLMSCVASPVLLYSGTLGETGYRNMLLAASAGWFVFATAWSWGRGKKTGG